MSNVGKEFESRVMLTEHEYLDVVSHFMKIYPNNHFLQNNNNYFDTNDFFLKNRHITLRVRTINDVRSELTLKIKGENGDIEINDDISFKEMEAVMKNKIFPDGNVKNYLLSLPIPLSDYENIVSLYNRRLEIQFNNHLLVIDKNEYNGIVDYNLEIETKDDINLANKLLSEYIQKFNLSLAKQKYQGKAHRALDSARKKD